MLQLDLFGSPPLQPEKPKKKVHELKPPRQIVEEPVVEEPKVEKPGVEEPKVEKPGVEEPKVEKPGVEEPKVEKPVAKEPVLEEPVAKEPVLEETPLTKSYYPISEVAAMFNVNISLLRFWEKEFDILQPRKNRKGDRLFRAEDIKHLRLIHFLLKEKKYTIEGARSFIKKGKKVNEKFEAIETLKNIRAMLVELKTGLL